MNTIEQQPPKRSATQTYWIVLVSVFLSLICLGALWKRGVEFSCWSGGYAQNAWLAYCNSTRYGVYDVEAIWHHVEDEVATQIHDAQIITLSDSHLQNALSLGAASDWFTENHHPIYMLGMPTAESEFGERLIDNFQLKPRVLILDASPYFTGRLGTFERPIFENPIASRKSVLDLKVFQIQHRRFCNLFSWACGHTFAYFRSRVDGHWIFPVQSREIWVGFNDVPNDKIRFPVNQTANESEPLFPIYLASARRLVEKLKMPRECIVITHVPSQEDLGDLPQLIGRSLGLTVIDPQLSGLFTFDRSHLSPESAKRWTQAFLTELSPVIEHCVNRAPTSLASAGLH